MVAPDGEELATFPAGKLPPGRYRLVVGSAALGYRDLGEVLLEPGEELALGTVVLDEAGRVLLSAELPDGLDPAAVEWSLVQEGASSRSVVEEFVLDASSAVGSSEPEGGGQLLDRWLAAGAYRAVATGPTLVATSFPVTVEPGATTELTLSLGEVVPARVRVSAAEGAEPLGAVQVTAFEASTGELAFERVIATGPLVVELFVPPGDWRFEARALGQRSGSLGVSVEAGDDPLEIELVVE